MSLHPVAGHQDARRVLSRARRRDALPSALLLHGPPGVGKQRMGLWVGQLLLCQAPGDDGPCHRCRSCRLAVRIEHPDLHWFFPLPRPRKTGTVEALEAAMEDARVDAIARFREDPLRPGRSEDPTGLHLPVARRIRALALRGPTDGPRQLILVARAHELVTQEASPEAANALLKLLEEPPPGTHLVLTSASPGKLLETVRSRTVPFHLGPIDRDEVKGFLERTAGAAPEAAEKAARLAPGSIGRALGFLPLEDGEPGPLDQTRRQAYRLVRAALRSRAHRFRTALEYPVTGARGMGELLDAVEVWLRDVAAVAEARGEGVLANPDAAEALRTMVESHGIRADRCGRAVLEVQEARALAGGNVNPQLLVTGLLARLRDELASEG